VNEPKKTGEKTADRRKKESGDRSQNTEDGEQVKVENKTTDSCLLTPDSSPPPPPVKPPKFKT